jgi:hypothetical protein
MKRAELTGQPIAKGACRPPGKDACQYRRVGTRLPQCVTIEQRDRRLGTVEVSGPDLDPGAPTEPSKRQSDIRSDLQSNNQTYRLMARASKYSFLIRVWFSPLVARLLSTQSCCKSRKSAACFGVSR